MLHIKQFLSITAISTVLVLALCLAKEQKEEHVSTVPNVVYLKSESELNDILTNNDSVVLMLHGYFCGPCKEMIHVQKGQTLSIIEQAAQKLSNITFVIAEAYKDFPQLAKRYGVQGFPTFALLHKGKKIAQFSGGSKLDRFIERLAPLSSKSASQVPARASEK